MAALVPDMFCDIYLVKIHNIANNSETSEDREKLSAYLEPLEFYDVFLTKFENYQILLSKIKTQMSSDNQGYLVGERA